MNKESFYRLFTRGLIAVDYHCSTIHSIYKCAIVDGNPVVWFTINGAYNESAYSLDEIYSFVDTSCLYKVVYLCDTTRRSYHE